MVPAGLVGGRCAPLKSLAGNGWNQPGGAGLAAGIGAERPRLRQVAWEEWRDAEMRLGRAS